MWKLWTACAMFAAGVSAPCAMAETRAAAVVDDGYAGSALQKIMEKYNAAGAQRQEAKLYLDSEGKLLDCRTLKGDVKALCQAARSAAPFGEPPYGVPTSIVVAVWTGKPEQAAKNAQKAKTEAPHAGQKAADSKYLANARRQLRNAMYIPEKTKPGTYHLTARIKCDPEGKILDSSILKGSGDSLLDKYALQGIHRAGAVDPPPAGMGGTFDVTFTLKR